MNRWYEDWEGGVDKGEEGIFYETEDGVRGRVQKRERESMMREKRGHEREEEPTGGEENWQHGEVGRGEEERLETVHETREGNVVGSAVYCNFLRHPSCSANNTRPRGSSVCSPSAFAGTSETRVTLEVGHIRPRFFTMMTLRAVPCVVHANSVSRVESRVPISSVASCHRVISGTNKSAILPHRRASVRLRVS